MNNYKSIIDYFESIATRIPAIAHHAVNHKSFTVADIQDALAGQNGGLISPYIIAGYEPEGIDRGSGLYRFSEGAKADRSYSINIAIFKEAKLDNTYESLDALDEIADAIFALIEADRLAAFDSNDPDLKCFHKDMSLDVPMYKTSIIGNRKALGLIMNFTFNFCR
jgi:hypothetical protein